MKIVCASSDFKSQIALVSRAVPSRPEPLVLGNILLVADQVNQQITLTAFDGSLGIATSFLGEVVEAGVVALPAKLLSDIVSRISEIEITLYCDSEAEDNFVTTLTAGSSKLQINGMDGSEFPDLPTVNGANAIDLPVAIVQESLKSCLFAASTELSKQVLTGIHLAGSNAEILEESWLEFAATDSHRLAVVRAFLENDEDKAISPEILPKLEKLGVTIPARALRELEKIIEGQTSIRMRYDGSQIVFETANKILTTLRLTGAYPPYERLIPVNFERTVVCDRKSLIGSLELVSVLAQKNNIVKFQIDSGSEEVTISVDTPDVGNAKQSLNAEVTGEDLEIAFNIKYFMEGLKAIPAQEVKIELNEWNQPVILSPLSGLKVTYLVMPVQIRG